MILYGFYMCDVGRQENYLMKDHFKDEHFRQTSAACCVLSIPPGIRVIINTHACTHARRNAKSCKTETAFDLRGSIKL